MKINQNSTYNLNSLTNDAYRLVYFRCYLEKLLLETHVEVCHSHSPLHHGAPLPWGHSEQDAARWFPQLTLLDTHVEVCHSHSPLHHGSPLPCGHSEQDAARWFPQLTWDSPVLIWYSYWKMNQIFEGVF